MAGEAMSAFVRFFVRDEVSGEVGEIERRARDAADGMDEAADAAGNRLRGAFDSAKGSAADFGKGLAAAGAGVTALIGGMVGLATGTAEFQEDMGKLQTAFEDQGHSMETANAVYGDFVGLLGETDQSVEAANHLAELTSNTQELSDWGGIAAGVYAKFGDSLPLEGLTEAANHTAKLGEVQGPLADALEWAGQSTEEFNAKLAACNSEEERASLITETLNGIYGEAGEAYRSNNADLIAQREAQSNLAAAMTELGNVVRPLVVQLMEVGTTIVTALQPAFQWLIDNLPTIIPIVTGIATAFLAYSGISAAVSAVSAVMTVLRDRTLLMAAAQGVLNAVMNLNPFVLVATLILGLVAAFVTAYATSEEFRNKVNAAFENVKSVVTSVVGTVKSVVSGMVDSMSSAFNSAYSTVTSVFNNIKSAITTAINTAKNAVTTAVSAIKGAFNFSWSLPKPKLPRFSVSGGKAPWGFMGQGSLPRVGISWYAKGGIFDAATLIPTEGGFAGVGERGAEAVAPIDVLLGYVRQAVREEVGGIGGYTANINVTTGETDESKLAKLIAREEKRQAYALGVI